MNQSQGILHNIAYFVGALACSCEKNLGTGSLSICSMAGKKFGTEIAARSPATDDPLKAIEILHQALEQEGIVWEFEPFGGEQGSALKTEGNKTIIRLAFYTCMVRNALFRYSHEQRLSLCYMEQGVFVGAMEKILPKYKVSLELNHAGPNGCLKYLTLEPKS